MAKISHRILLLGLVLVPFGPVDELVKKPLPYRAFDSDFPSIDSLLTVVRLDVVALSSGAPSCSRWLEALQQPLGASYDPKRGPVQLDQAWAPWREEDEKILKDCDDLPCDVKLGPKEVEAMKNVDEKARKLEFLKLISQRIDRYLKSGNFEEYEFPGKMIDPWITFERMGFKSQPLALPDPAHRQIGIRRMDLAPEKLKPLRQVFDRRVAVSDQGGVAWLRAAYTTHYFDAWGEWMQVSCQGGKIQILQALQLDLDMLKQTDILSVLGREKMRRSVKELGDRYLDHQLEDLRHKAEAPIPAPAEIPASPKNRRLKKRSI